MSDPRVNIGTREIWFTIRSARTGIIAMGEGGHQVTLHLYDLSQGMARAMSPALLGRQIDGVWHTGIVVHGQEYYFGGGIQVGYPGGTHFGRPMQVIPMGETHIPEELLQEFLAEISPRFTMHTYNLLRWNCNNFSNEVAQFLVGKEIPSHILSLPDDVMNTPLGQQLMPFLNMMEAQMRTASEQGVGQGGMHQWTPPSGREGVHSLAPATAVESATVSTATAEEAVPTPPVPEKAAEEATKVDTAEEATKVDTAEEATKVDAAEAAKARIETAMRAEFDRIMAEGGKTPNEAAAEALEIIRARAGKLGS